MFTHGDYQHFNVLWSRGRLSALVDWSSACVAPADLDVGHCRLNLAVLFSPEVAEDFRRAVRSPRRADGSNHGGTSISSSVTPRVGGPSFRSRWPVGASLDIRGMTGRVEELLAIALART